MKLKGSDSVRTQEFSFNDDLQGIFQSKARVHFEPYKRSKELGVRHVTHLDAGSEFDFLLLHFFDQIIVINNLSVVENGDTISMVKVWMCVLIGNPLHILTLVEPLHLSIPRVDDAYVALDVFELL